MLSAAQCEASDRLTPFNPEPKAKAFVGESSFAVASGSGSNDSLPTTRRIETDTIPFDARILAGQ